MRQLPMAVTISGGRQRKPRFLDLVTDETQQSRAMVAEPARTPTTQQLFNSQDIAKYARGVQQMFCRRRPLAREEASSGRCRFGGAALPMTTIRSDHASEASVQNIKLGHADPIRRVQTKRTSGWQQNVERNT